MYCSISSSSFAFLEKYKTELHTSPRSHYVMLIWKVILNLIFVPHPYCWRQCRYPPTDLVTQLVIYYTYYILNHTALKNML